MGDDGERNMVEGEADETAATDTEGEPASEGETTEGGDGTDAETGAEAGGEAATE